MSQPGRITTLADGPIGHVVIDQPARRNALTLAMWQAIPAAIEGFARDPAIRVLVLSGAGDQAFAAGADISQFEAQRATEEQGEVYAAAVAGAGDAIAGLRKPTIAMIRGVCYGGGTGLALACDLRLAGDDARIAITAAKLGIGYPYDGLKRLTDLVGPARAKEMMFLAEPLDAAQALSIGLVNRVVPAAELRSFVADYAGRIARNAPLTLAAAKLGIDNALAPAPDLAACAAAVAACGASEDYVEGRRAFVEKRKPAFRGV